MTNDSFFFLITIFFLSLCSAVCDKFADLGDEIMDTIPPIEYAVATNTVCGELGTLSDGSVIQFTQEGDNLCKAYFYLDYDIEGNTWNSLIWRVPWDTVSLDTGKFDIMQHCFPVSLTAFNHLGCPKTYSVTVEIVE